MTNYESILNETLELSKTFKVYPLNRFTNIPLKGSHGELDATNDHETIVKWFDDDLLISIGLYLKDTNIFVLDMDDHKENGEAMKELAKLSNGESLGEPTVVKSPTGQGKHFYYRFPPAYDIQDNNNFTENIEILRTKVTAPYSRKRVKDGSIGTYELELGSFDDIKEAPTWLLNKILKKQFETDKSKQQYTNEKGTKKWTAVFLEEVVHGVDESQRNIWLTRITGKLFGLGMDAQEAYQLITVINESFVNPSLQDKEVNTIFQSILKREVRKRGI